MSGSVTEDLAPDILKTLMESALQAAGAPKQVIDVATFMVENSLLYIEFCVAQKKNPDDVQSILLFLAKKGKAIAKLSVEDLACSIALYDFAEGLVKRGKWLRGGPIPATIVVSLTLMDALGAANSCTFIQEAYYHAFLKSSSSKVTPIAERERETTFTAAPFNSPPFSTSGPDLKAKKDALMCSALGGLGPRP